MKELFFGEANRFTRQPFESGAQGEVLALQALHRAFASLSLLDGQTGFVGAPGIGKPLFYRPSSLGQHGQQAPESSVRSPPKHEGHDLSRARIFDLPAPALLFFAAHKRPPLVGAQA